MCMYFKNYEKNNKKKNIAMSPMNDMYREWMNTPPYNEIVHTFFCAISMQKNKVSMITQIV